MSTPEHGTVSRRKYHGCTCELCRQAWRDYERRVRRLQAYGRWEPFVDATATREHVQRLQDAGIGPKRLAELSGIGYATISTLVWGDKQRVRHATEAAILAVQPGLDAYADGAVIDGTGTRRRIQALAVLGWSIPVQARLLGISRSSVQNINAGHGVYAATARKAVEVYEKLWDQPPPEVSLGERISAGRARAEAARNGWAPPMAWDEESIDDPAAEPEGAQAKTRGKLPSGEELRWLHVELRETIPALAQRFGVYESSIRKALERAA